MGHNKGGAALRPVENLSWKNSEGQEGAKMSPETKFPEIMVKSHEKCGVCKSPLGERLFYGRIDEGRHVACSKSCNKRYYMTDPRVRSGLLDGNTPFPKPPEDEECNLNEPLTGHRRPRVT